MFQLFTFCCFYLSFLRYCFPFPLFIYLSFFVFPHHPPTDVIQLNKNDEYWLQLFPSRGVVSNRTYNYQELNRDRIFTIPDGSVFYVRQCSLIKLPILWYDVDVVSKLRRYNMTKADAEHGDWSIFPIVQEYIF